MLTAERVPVEVERYRFTVEQYHQLADIGILNEDSRVELIDGEILTMSPIGWRHMRIVNNLNRLFVTQAAGRYTVSPQNGLIISEHSEPQPDIVLLTGDGPYGRLPTAADIALVVEVSDTTLAYDLNVKLPRYARAGVPELWIINVASEAIERFTAPDAAGHYATRDRFGLEDAIEAATLPSLRLNVRDIFS
jgi:Uma2 family endonuclease